MPKQRPNFDSDIPQHLLSQASPEGRWMMEQISIQNKKTEYLLDEQDAQSLKLDSIEAQVKYTNGQVKDHAVKVNRFVALAQDIEDIVGTKKFLEKVSGSKWFWACCGVFLIGLYQVAMNPVFRDWISKFF